MRGREHCSARGLLQKRPLALGQLLVVVVEWCAGRDVVVAIFPCVDVRPRWITCSLTCGMRSKEVGSGAGGAVDLTKESYILALLRYRSPCPTLQLLVMLLEEEEPDGKEWMGRGELKLKTLCNRTLPWLSP